MQQQNDQFAKKKKESHETVRDMCKLVRLEECFKVILACSSFWSFMSGLWIHICTSRYRTVKQ